MQKINIIQNILDETQTLMQIAKDLPAPYNVVVKHQAEIIDSYSTELYTIETDREPTPEPTQKLAGDIFIESETEETK